MSNTFSVTVLGAPAPVESFPTRHEAREAARSFTAQGGGRRVRITAKHGPTDEHYWGGVRSHHYTRNGAFVIDDRQAYREYVACRFGEPLTAALLGPVADTP